jgi:type I restriction enzyme S subunit
LKEGQSNLYFYFLLQSKHVQDQVLLHTLGQAVKGINIAEVKKLFFGLPKLNEQNVIAERLNEIEKLLGTTDQDLNKLYSVKTALMQDLLTGKKRVTSLLVDTMVTN